MKRSPWFSTALVLALGVSAGMAFAHDRRDDRRDDRRPGAHERHAPHPAAHAHDHWRVDRHRHRGPGVGPGHRYHRGDHLPRAHRGRHHVVHDWRGHRLHAPGRGHHWVQLGGDFALVASGSGIIAQIVIGR